MRYIHNALTNNLYALILRAITFDEYGYLLSGDDRVEIFNNSYDTYLEKLFGYIDTYYY